MKGDDVSLKIKSSFLKDLVGNLSLSSSFLQLCSFLEETLQDSTLTNNKLEKKLHLLLNKIRLPIYTKILNKTTSINDKFSLLAAFKEHGGVNIPPQFLRDNSKRESEEKAISELYLEYTPAQILQLIPGTRFQVYELIALHIAHIPDDWKKTYYTDQATRELHYIHRVARDSEKNFKIKPLLKLLEKLQILDLSLLNLVWVF